MLISGLIIGVITLILTLGFTTLISPLCAPCLAILLGLGAGFLAGIFDKPADNNGAVKTGAGAGALGGLGAIIGQIIGTAVNALMVGPEGAAQFAEIVGLPTGDPASFETGYWGGLIGSACCFGILDIALMAGLGALGGLLWWQTMGKNAVSSE